jgi:hypothetical protein
MRRHIITLRDWSIVCVRVQLAEQVRVKIGGIQTHPHTHTPFRRGRGRGERRKRRAEIFGWLVIDDRKRGQGWVDGPSVIML